MSQEDLIGALARCILAGEPSYAGIVARGTQMLGRSWQWLDELARRYVKATSGVTRLRHRQVADFIFRDSAFQEAWEKHSEKLVRIHLLTEPQRMQPVAAAAQWNLPRIETPADLADWFWLDMGQLEWFADLCNLAEKSKDSRLRHYHYRALLKDSGGIRLIESPKPHLKSLQTQILEEILNRVPAHGATHGFVKRRSTLTFAAPHVGKAIVIRMDLKDFFPAFGFARIQAFFRTLGYPEAVADLLGGICTTAAPKLVGGVVYSQRHLPQGAPNSPALANLCAYGLDCRLAGLAKASGGVYSRYADDLAFSGDDEFARGAERFSLHAAAVVMQEGFDVHHRKTRIMRQGVRQHLAGIVTNARMNIPRADFDRLKAMLTNCVRLGAQSQNREQHPAFQAHLNGRVAYMEMVNPAKGERLRRIFERIEWTGAALL